MEKHTILKVISVILNGVKLIRQSALKTLHFLNLISDDESSDVVCNVQILEMIKLIKSDYPTHNCYLFCHRP